MTGTSSAAITQYAHSRAGLKSLFFCYRGFNIDNLYPLKTVSQQIFSFL